MTPEQRAAMEQGLELLDRQWQCTQLWSLEEAQDAADNIRKVLAEQPAQKCNYPYCGCDSKAWCKVERNAALDKMAENAREIGLDYGPVIDKSAAIRIATALGWEPKREWVGLTDEDLAVCDEDGVRLARYWERVLREKNNG